MASLNKNSADLFGTQHLTILIKYFTDQSAIFLSAFLEPSIAPLISENMVVESSSRDIQCLTRATLIHVASLSVGREQYN